MKVPKEILDQHVAVLGKTGSGKTSTAKLAIEQVVGEGARVCVLDPIKSDWWGLTSSADGRREGLPFHILGGPRGHVPLHSSAGKAIGEIVANGSLPLSIIDMADFEPGGQAKFFVDFAPTLLRKMRGVVYLVIEEAHLFAPKERSGIGAENLSIHWAKTMATAGRSKGVRLVVVTQRTQALHNALLGSCDTLIAHRLTAPADQKPVIDWLKANTSKEVLERVSRELASLKTGHGWICSGEAKLFAPAHFDRISTYDNTATPTGDGETRTVKTAAVDQDRLRAIIGDAVEQAKADDPKELRKRIADLERQIQNRPAGITPAPQIEERQVLTDADRELLRNLGRTLEGMASELGGRSGAYLAGIEATLVKAVEEGLARAVADGERVHKIGRDEFLGILEGKRFTAILEKLGSVTVARPVMSAHARASAAMVEKLASPKPAPSAGPGEPLPAGERATLIAAAQYPEGLTREQATILTGYKRSTRDAYIQRLAGRGFVEVRGSDVFVTQAGVNALGSDYEPLPTGQALRDYWLQKLPAGEREVLRIVLDSHPREADREAIGESAGFKRSTRDAYIQRLAVRKLVIPGRGTVRASAVLFD